MGFRTALTDLFGIRHPILLAPMGGVSGGALAAAAAQAGDVSSTVVWASEAVDLIRDLPPAAEIVQRMLSEASAALQRGLARRDDADR